MHSFHEWRTRRRKRTSDAISRNHQAGIIDDSAAKVHTGSSRGAKTIAGIVLLLPISLWAIAHVLPRLDGAGSASGPGNAPIAAASPIQDTSSPTRATTVGLALDAAIALDPTPVAKTEAGPAIRALPHNRDPSRLLPRVAPDSSILQADTATATSRASITTPRAGITLVALTGAPAHVPGQAVSTPAGGPASATQAGGYIRPMSGPPPVRAAAVAPTLAPHPRLILDAPTLAKLRSFAAANDPAWQTLKSVCDSYIGGTVNYPSEEAYENLPDMGAGYEGEVYLPVLLSESLCYQTLKVDKPSEAAKYGAKAVDILVKMSAPYNNGNGKGWDPNHDSGYPIRNYGVGFGLGYDWLYELLTPGQREQVYTTANEWITAFETNTFEYDHPQSNYFAGYFHTKAAVSLATYGDNPQAPAQWEDWLDNQFGKRVQPYYAEHLTGGGWPEGFANYAPLGILNMTLPAREVKTATGIDLVHGSAPYTFPLDNADYVMHFTWPSRDYFDDRDTNRSTNNYQPGDPPPGTTQTGMFRQILGTLMFWDSPKVAVLHQYVNAVEKATNNFGRAVPWLRFLNATPDVPTAPLSTLPRSYLARGMSAVAARSDWTTDASWMSFRAGPYTNFPSQGEQYFDQGSLALVRGSTPLLVNASGWIVHEPGGSDDEERIYNDNFGKTDGGLYKSNRQLYNVFYVRAMDGNTVRYQYGQAAYTTEDYDVRTKVSAFEDGGDYVYVLATHLEDMYRPFPVGPSVVAWSRQIVYLRPDRFVVYDRTTSGSSSYDQYLAWAFPATPSAGSAPTGGTRLDVNFDGHYAGAMTTVLPANATTQTVPLYPDSTPIKAWQVQVRAPDSATGQRWLTVFDLSSTPQAVATSTPITVTQGDVVGVWIAAGTGDNSGNNVVVSSSGAAGTPVSGDFGYEIPDAAAYHVITDLKPATGYSINAVRKDNSLKVTVSTGGTLMASSKGVLGVNISAAGDVSTDQPTYTRLPINTMPVAPPQPWNGG